MPLTGVCIQKTSYSCVYIMYGPTADIPNLSCLCLHDFTFRCEIITSPILPHDRVWIKLWSYFFYGFRDQFPVINLHDVLGSKKSGHVYKYIYNLTVNM
ncbi:hypothetical protein GDO86_009202 [Hymenochirus boettgeri]|uniref:Uncharacterized protein n=1 Tax=Hymenochirus boettgeri TaxID=247094 RepID=A0A8T2JFH4_9PIPI|nr:hypothetical protein GDO86_009202 [Hymenochirus boettgeri]